MLQKIVFGSFAIFFSPSNKEWVERQVNAGRMFRNCTEFLYQYNFFGPSFVFVKREMTILVFCVVSAALVQLPFVRNFKTNKNGHLQTVLAKLAM